VRLRLPRFHGPLDGERGRILFWMCVLIATNQLGFGGIVPVVPLYAESFGVTKTAIGLTIAVYGLARFLVAVPAGALADRRGRRSALALGGVVTVVGNALCAAAPNYEAFLAARFVAGAGASLVLLGGQVVLADITSPENRGRVMALYQGVFLFAVGAGTIPGGLLATHLGLRAPFVANAALAAGVGLLAWYRVPETRDLRRRDGEAKPTGPRPPLVAQWRIFARTPGFLLIGLVSFVGFFARTGALFNVVPVLARDGIGLKPDAIGLGLASVSVVSLALAYPSGVLVDRFGRKAVIAPSTILTGMSMLLFAVAPNFTWYLVACLAWSSASGIGGASPAAYAADVAPAGMNASALGAYRALADMGYVVGPLLLGVVSDVWSPEAALGLTTTMLVVSGLVFARFAPETYRRQPVSGASPPSPSGSIAEPTPGS